MRFYRAMASLPPVAEEPALSATVVQHARYMVAHDVIQDSQNRRRSWSTPGDAIVLIPREPLTVGSRYRVQIEVNGQQINWTFGVASLSR